MESQIVLIAAPTYDGKEYAMERWWNAVNRITYQPTSVVLIDNSDTLDFYWRWVNKVPMIHLHLEEETPDRKIALSMEYIRTEIFLARNYRAWLNLEVDVIPPPTVVDVMLFHSQGVDFTAAPYKHRTEDRWVDGCFGCSMFSRKIAEVGFSEAPSDTHTDAWFRNLVIGKYRLNDMPHHVLPLQHLDK